MEKFKEKLLKELLFDLMVCKIERWDASEYIKNLHEIINSLYESTVRGAGQDQARAGCNSRSSRCLNAAF